MRVSFFFEPGRPSMIHSSQIYMLTIRVELTLIGSLAVEHFHFHFLIILSRYYALNRSLSYNDIVELNVLHWGFGMGVSCFVFLGK